MKRSAQSEATEVYRLPRKVGSKQIFSPYALAIMSYGLFLLAWLMPPGIYTACMGEPDLLFLDPATILFYTLCVAFFLGGVWLVDILFPTPFFVRRKVETKGSPTAFLLGPLAVGTALCVASTVLLLRNYPSLMLLIFSQQANEIKQDVQTRQPLGLAAMCLVAIVWWALWRFPQLGFRGKSRRLAKVGIVLAAVAALISSALKLSRSELMPTVMGIVLIWYVEKIATRRVKVARVAKYALIFVLCVGALFSGFTFARGARDAQSYGQNLLGYTVASYNRLAAMVNGRLHYPFAGHGVYLSGFLSFNASFNKVVPIAQYMDWPKFTDVWGSEFTATWQAGLDGGFIWSGAFGYIFSDFGWFAPLLLLIYGLLYGVVWRSMKRGRILGIVLYPWFAFCILFWFGTNYLFDTRIVLFFLVGLTLMLYESMMTRRRSGVLARAPGAGLRISGPANHAIDVRTG